MQRHASVPDWGVKPDRARGAGIQGALVLGAFIVVAFALTYALGPAVGVVPVLVINLVIALTAAWWMNVQGLLALRSVKAVRARPEDEPRLANIAAGLARDIGIRPPALYVIDAGGPNAIACIARGPAVAVTKSLLDGYTRTELEAVVAHSLVRLASGTIERATLGVALGPFGTRSLPPVGRADDVHACALTRYPPALANAVERAEPRSGRFAAFWFVADGGGHRDRAEREAAIRQL